MPSIPPSNGTALLPTPSTAWARTPRNCGGSGRATEPKINEFSASTTGTDVEYVEVYGAPNTDYSAYTILEIEGDAVEMWAWSMKSSPLAPPMPTALWLANLPANALENGSLTPAAGQEFHWRFGDDLDTDNDGVFDVTPWDAVVDSVAVNDGGAGDITYGAPVLGPNYDGLSNFAPGGASRIPDGFDTDAASRLGAQRLRPGRHPRLCWHAWSWARPTTRPARRTKSTSLRRKPAAIPSRRSMTCRALAQPARWSGLEVAVEGVVVGDFQNNAIPDNGDLNGFHVQDPAGDGDAGHFGRRLRLRRRAAWMSAVGDAVRVRGSVSEYNGLTEITRQPDLGMLEPATRVAPTALSLPVASPDAFEALRGHAGHLPAAAGHLRILQLRPLRRDRADLRPPPDPHGRVTNPVRPRQLQAVQDICWTALPWTMGARPKTPTRPSTPTGQSLT